MPSYQVCIGSFETPLRALLLAPRQISQRDGRLNEDLSPAAFLFALNARNALLLPVAPPPYHFHIEIESRGLFMVSLVPICVIFEHVLENILRVWLM